MMSGSPALSFGWMLWRRNRLGIVLVLAYSALLTTLSLLLPSQQNYDGIVFTMCIPFLFVCVWVFGEFTFSQDSDLTSRDAGFPARMYTLPIGAKWLVAFPMVYGAIVVVAVWFAFSQLFLRPRGVEVPVFWPSTFALALLGWTQVLSWRAFPHASIRFVVSMIVLTGVVALTVAAIQLGYDQRLVGVAGLIQFAIAYLIALQGVASSRCGNTGRAISLPNIRAILERPLKHDFRSAFQAHYWVERRINGLALPITISFLSIVFVISAWFGNQQGSSIPYEICMRLYFLPVIFAVFVATAMSRFQRKQGVMPMGLFYATRPTSSGTLLKAKFASALTSVALSYAIVGCAILLICLTTNAGEILVQMIRNYATTYSVEKAVASYGGWAIGVPILTYLLIIDHLWMGLTGRKWLAMIQFGAMLALVVGIMMVMGMVVNREHTVEDVRQFWWIVLGGLAAVKTAAAFALIALLLQRKLAKPATLAISAIAWLSFVICTIVYVRECFGIPEVVIDYVPIATMVLAPGLGLLLAPFALDYNRRRT